MILPFDSWLCQYLLVLEMIFSLRHTLNFLAEYVALSLESQVVTFELTLVCSWLHVGCCWYGVSQVFGVTVSADRSSEIQWKTHKRRKRSPHGFLKSRESQALHLHWSGDRFDVAAKRNGVAKVNILSCFCCCCGYSSTSRRCWTSVEYLVCVLVSLATIAYHYEAS
jgi:hypothetical protein